VRMHIEGTREPGEPQLAKDGAKVVMHGKELLGVKRTGASWKFSKRPAGSGRRASRSASLKRASTCPEEANSMGLMASVHSLNMPGTWPGFGKRLLPQRLVQLRRSK
jgi:hypothetical protein